MKIIEPYFEILHMVDSEEIMRVLELAARNCYKSEDKIGPGSAEKILKSILKSGHDSILEHIAVTVRIVCDRGVMAELTRHRAGIGFSVESTRYCVSGETILSVKNHLYSNLTVHELYQNKISSKNGSWKRINIRQLNERTGQLEYATIENVFYMGKKDTFRLKTKLGYEIVTTGDHEVLTDSGYVKMSSLIVGDKVSVNGTTALYQNKQWLHYHYNYLNKTAVQIEKEFGINKSTIKKWVRKHNLPKKPLSYWNKGKKPWNKGLTEDDHRVAKQAKALRKYHWNDGNLPVMPSRKDRIKILSKSTYHKIVDTQCSICKRNNNLQVHHIDEDRNNNSKDNLITLCASCHQGLHYKNVEVPFLDDIMSIENDGVKDVYDISMKSEFKNFVADGIIVHNCNFSKEKFDREITVIRPFFWEMDSDQYMEWERAMEMCEKAYMTILDQGAKAQEARSVLPNSLKTDIVVTANIREWIHVFKLRCSKSAHPQARQTMRPILAEFRRRLPVLFDDIKE